MKNDRMYLRCKYCGNLVGMIEDSGVHIVCCGEEMEVLKANTVEASAEKHLPTAERDGCKLKVKVGSVPHPMTPDHYITWIAVAQGTHTQRIALAPTDQAEAVFCVDDGPVTVYEYCNLHGLWAAEF